MSGPVARAFLVVRLAPASGDDDAPSVAPIRACVSATYGADGGDGTDEDRELVATVRAKNFAIPEYPSEAVCAPVKDDATSDPQTYTFSLTEGDGSRTTGFCRRIVPPRVDGDGETGRTTPRYPLVACILSKNAWFSFFDEALASIDAQLCDLPRVNDATEDVTDDLPNDSELGRFMRELCARPSPAPGSSIVVPFPWHRPGTAYPSQIELAAPASGGPGGRGGNASNPDVKFASLLRQPGGTYAVVSLFAALLMERRVVISGSDLNRVSSAVVAANASMYPLAWQHIYLPLMPRDFVDYLTAPMPFLVGLHSSLVPAMRALPTEDIFHLDLDSGECSCFPEDLDSMPTRTTQTLQSALKKASRLGGGTSAAGNETGGDDPIGVGGVTSSAGLVVHTDDDAAAAAFRRFFSQTLGPYRRHIVQDGRKTRDGRSRSEDNIGANGLWLDHEGLARSAPTKRTGSLLRCMRQGQHFEVFARERLDAIASALKSGEEVLYKDVDFDTEMDDYAEMYDVVRQSAVRASAAAASYASYGYKKSAEYYSSFMKSSYEAYSAYYNKSTSSGSTPRGAAKTGAAKRVAVPGLGLATVVSPSPGKREPVGTERRFGASPADWEGTADRFRRATASSDSLNDVGEGLGPTTEIEGTGPTRTPTPAARETGFRTSGGGEKGGVESVESAKGEPGTGADSLVVEPAIVNGDAGVDERFASPPPVPPSPPPPAVSPPTVALGDLLGLADDPAPSPAGGIGIDWMNEFVTPSPAPQDPGVVVDDLAAQFDQLASPTPQKAPPATTPGTAEPAPNLLDL